MEPIRESRRRKRLPLFSAGQRNNFGHLFNGAAAVFARAIRARDSFDPPLPSRFSPFVCSYFSFYVFLHPAWILAPYQSDRAYIRRVNRALGNTRRLSAEHDLWRGARFLEEAKKKTKVNSAFPRYARHPGDFLFFVSPFLRVLYRFYDQRDSLGQSTLELSAK